MQLNELLLRTRKSNLKKAFENAFAFFIFSAAYYLPFFLDKPPFSLTLDDRVEALIKSLISKPTAQIDIVRNFAGHLCLLLGYFLFLLHVAQLLKKLSSLRSWIALTITLIAGWVFLIAINARFFPRSNYSFAFEALAHPEFAYSIGLVFSAALVWLVVQLLRTSSRTRQLLAISAMVTLAVSCMSVFGMSSRKGPSVIIVGIDSLSEPALEKLRGSLPNLNKLLESGTSYTRAYTPLGRTYPAWISILSGKSPSEHGAIENLRSLDKVEKEDLLSRDMQAHGYHTVFAIDERRFNNIDQSFGFDTIIGPKAGALDFVMQWFNDTPLTNVLMQTSVAQYFFPFSYINTESVVNYDANGFVDEVIKAADSSRPLFLAVHFESAHFPFETRHAKREFHTPNEFLNKQAAALTVVDAQVARLISKLERDGYLDKAIVILLSDHGEGLGDLEAIVTKEGASTELRGYGHGGDVLSDHQNHIVLGVMEFRNGRAVGDKAEVSQQVSLLEIRSLISRYLNTGASNIETRQECIPVETGVRLTSEIDYKSLDEEALAASGAENYEIDREGRLRLREDHITKLVRTKDVGWRCRDRLTYFSYPDNKYFSYALGTDGEPTSERPLIEDDVRQIESYRRHLENDLR